MKREIEPKQANGCAEIRDKPALKVWRKESPTPRLRQTVRDGEKGNWARKNQRKNHKKAKTGHKRKYKQISRLARKATASEREKAEWNVKRSSDPLLFLGILLRITFLMRSHQIYINSPPTHHSRAGQTRRRHLVKSSSSGSSKHKCRHLVSALTAL